jgi:hypothetical protein
VKLSKCRRGLPKIRISCMALGNMLARKSEERVVKRNKIIIDRENDAI